MLRELVLASAALGTSLSFAGMPPCGPETDPAAEIIVDRPPTPDEIASAPTVILIFDHFHCRGPDFKWILTSSVPQPRNN
jgi:hypothetical protein